MHGPPNLPDSGSNFFGGQQHGGGFDLSQNNAHSLRDLLIQIAAQVENHRQNINIISQEVAGLRSQFQRIDKDLASTQNRLDGSVESIKRMGERIGAVESALNVIRADLDSTRQNLADLMYSLRSLGDKLAALEKKDDEQGQEIADLREWRIRLVASMVVVSAVISFLGPKLWTVILPDTPSGYTQPHNPDK